MNLSVYNGKAEAALQRLEQSETMWYWKEYDRKWRVQDVYELRMYIREVERDNRVLSGRMEGIINDTASTSVHGYADGGQNLQGSESFR